jgi:hypothetical protein
MNADKIAQLLDAVADDETAAAAAAPVSVVIESLPALPDPFPVAITSVPKRGGWQFNITRDANGELSGLTALPIQVAQGKIASP